MTVNHMFMGKAAGTVGRRKEVRRCAMVVLAAAVLLAAPGVAAGQSTPTARDTASLDALLGRLGRAEAAHDDTAFVSAARAIVQRLPSHPFALALAARASARSGDAAGALAQLDRLADMGDTRPIEDATEFAALRTMPAFRRIAAQLAANRRPVTAGETIYTLPDPDFLPESVALDTATGDLYLGSLVRRQLVRVVRRDGRPVRIDTLAGPADGLLRVVGIEIDAPRDLVWFATWSPPVDGAQSPARRVTHTRLFSYHRASRALRRYDVADSLHAHLLNDLVVTPEGDVYVTDTAEGTVWRLPVGSATLERLTRPEPTRFSGANGIARAPDGRRLYVAYSAGIAVVDLRTREVRWLALPPDVTTAGVDGLYWHRGGLVAVQGLGTDERVVRFSLDGTGTRVTGARVIERGPPVFRRPTTGSLVGDDLYYIPDAQYERLRWDGTLAPGGRASTVRWVRLAE